jgi:hypothetical protein
MATASGLAFGNAAEHRDVKAGTFPCVARVAAQDTHAEMTMAEELDGRGSTVAQLKDDIDRNRTGSKVNFSDPGLSPLGTDDEAAGRPTSPERVASARAQEQKIGRIATANDKPQSNIPVLAMIGVVVVVVIVVIAFYLSR